MPKKDVYNLTNPQKNIYQVEMTFKENTSINHITSFLKLDGNLDPVLLDKTINKIIELNDSFRIKFIEKDENLFQYIDEYKYTPINVVNLDKDDVDEFIDNYKKLEISLKTPFNFTIVLTPSCSFIFYKSHHIIADAWGMTQVAEQIKEIYTLLENDKDLSTYTKPSYLTLINRETKYFESKKYDIDKDFWLNYVASIDDTKPFNNINIFEAKASRFEQVIDNDLFNKISVFCKENGISNYSFFLGIIAIYFNKIYSQKSIVIGTPFLNRQKRLGELESTGLHVSILPLNINIIREDNFIDLCKTINFTNLAIYKHSGFPFHQIQELYNSLNNNTSKLFDVGFSYQINHLKSTLSSRDSGICSWLFSGEQTQPLTIHVSTLNNYKVMFYDYLNSCFTEDEIKKANEIIFNIINQVLNGKTLLKSIVALTAEDITAISSFNDTGSLEKPTESVIAIFEKIVKEYPNNIAISCGDKKITYSELAQKVNFLYKILAFKGVNKNIPVALFFDKSIEMITSMLAVLKAGGCYVPILPDESHDRIRYILKDCKPKCILTHKDYDLKLEFANNVLNLDKMEHQESFSFINNEINSCDPAYIIYTSGSTGNPKGVIITHGNICGLKMSIENDFVLRATSNDVSMSLLKYSFDASGIDIYTALLFGGKLVLVEKDDELNPEKVLQIIEKHKVTRSFLIPKWIEHISLQITESNYDLSSLRILGTGGEILKPYILENLLEKYSNLKILNLYGPTEATMFTTYKVVSVYEVRNNYTSIGAPIYGSRLAIVNDFGDFLPQGTNGELVIYEDDASITNLASGYLNLPDITKNKFVQLYNPIINKQVKAYKTGDIAKLNKNLELEFIGRTDDIVKVNGGYLVALAEIEKQISKILGKSYDICTVAISHQNTKAIILFITSNDSSSIPLSTIKKHINSNLSFYMRPKKIIEIEHFPRNSSGKINRSELKLLAENLIAEQRAKMVLPKTKTEKELYDIICKYVDSQEISIEDDFIDDLGIDSLTLTSIYTSLSHYNLNIQDLYNNSSIQSLANMIETNNANNTQIDLSNIQDAKILNNVNKFNLKTVLITGVTGFLGVHIFYNLLLDSEVEKIYCIIRSRLNQSGRKALEKVLEYYFPSNSELIKLVDKKVIILNGDISKNLLGLSLKAYKTLQEETTTVINCAANVKHFAKPAQIRKDNVTSVNNLIDFCKNNISLAHMSTLSIAGFNSDSTNNKIFNENTLYIGQDFSDNPYLISKFEAEKNILIATNKYELNAVIFRLGNIMPRYSDGVFQKNFSQNVFLSALRAIIKSSVIAKDLNSLKIEFSPVDECSKMIMSLLKNTSNQSIYHILSNKEITILELRDLLKPLNYNMLEVDLKTFIDEIQKNSDEYTKEYILNNNLNNYSQDLTLSVLNNLGLDWSNININYLTYIIDIINKF